MEVLGDRQSIELNIPKDPDLIKPNGTQSTKVSSHKIQVFVLFAKHFFPNFVYLPDWNKNY